jgi:hypothetical protein
VIFMVTAHKYPAQCGRLLRRLRLSFPDARLAVHVDAKSELQPFVEEADGTEAVFVTERHRVSWGAFSLVEAMLALTREATRGEFDRAFFLSEQDYPLTTPAALNRHLARNPDAQFMSAHRDPEQMARYERFDFPDLPGIIRRPARAAANRLQHPRLPPRELSKGGAWCSVTHPCLDYILSETQRDTAFMRYLRTCPVPDEVVFQSIVMTSPFRETVRPSLTYTRFTGLAHPLIWRSENLGELLGSGCHFARKFDIHVDSRVLDLLDQRIDLR